MQWSPDGLTIAFDADDGNVWTVPVSGASAPKKVLARTVKYRYIRPIWSPDSQYLAAEQDNYSGTSLIDANLVRLPAGGGTPVDLGKALPSATSGGAAIRWVPNN